MKADGRPKPAMHLRHFNSGFAGSKISSHVNAGDVFLPVARQNRFQVILEIRKLQMGMGIYHYGIYNIPKIPNKEAQEDMVSLRFVFLEGRTHGWGACGYGLPRAAANSRWI